MKTNEELMSRCLDLARRGAGKVSPNPMVGCVLVRNGEIIGEGFHESFGGPHAEVNAARSAGSSVEGAEVFVNLEPCSYFGKTPPCADLLIEKKVRKVHVAMLDPNPRVNGNGVKKLKTAGIEVEVGLLGDEARRLNEVFVKYITAGLPFVTLKIAQSLDGKIALADGTSKYITSAESLREVHSLRAEHDAVLVGAGTVIADNPSLTVRYVEGKSPVRIILDGKLRTPVRAGIFHDGKAKVIVLYSMRQKEKIPKKIAALEKLGVETVALIGGRNGSVPLRTVLRTLAGMGISSLLVEGGAGVFSQFLSSKLADKIQLFIAPTIIGEGKGFSDGIEILNLKRALRVKSVEITRFGPDINVNGYL